MEVYQSIRLSIPYARSLEKKKLRLAELLTLVDPKATQTKEGSVNRVFKRQFTFI
jgi:hypothetical protein